MPYIKGNLVADIEVINNSADSGQLYPMAARAKEVLDVEEITVLADKGYSKNYKDLISCESNGIITYAALQDKPSIDEEGKYSADHFKYDEEKDTYTCPQGQILYFHRSRTIKTTECRDYKNFRACKKCPVKDYCTKSSRGRSISRSEASKTIENMVRRMKDNQQLYKRRQMIVEPVFGTLKRSMGFTYFLTRGFKKVRGEAALAFCAYNMRRVISILGVKEIVKRLATI